MFYFRWCINFRWLLRKKKMLPRCRCRRASGILSVAFFVFIVFQIIVLQSQKPIKSLDSSWDIKEGRRLFGENSKDDQISSLFSHPADSTVLVSYVYKMMRLPSGADYNLTYPHLEDFARGQCAIIDEYLNKTVSPNTVTFSVVGTLWLAFEILLLFLALGIESRELTGSPGVSLILPRERYVCLRHTDWVSEHFNFAVSTR